MYFISHLECTEQCTRFHCSRSLNSPLEILLCSKVWEPGFKTILAAYKYYELNTSFIGFFTYLIENSSQVKIKTEFIVIYVGNKSHPINP